MQKEERTLEFGREKFVNGKIKKYFFRVDLIILTVMLVLSFLSYIFLKFTILDFLIVLVITSIIITLDFFLQKSSLYKAYNHEFDMIISVSNLSPDNYIEVLPTKNYIPFISIAKFYAIIKNASTVDIYIKYDNANKLKLLENISNENFATNYKIS